ncbi:hypothetical protein JYU29_01805 [Tianweitania sp. BSSL-BM11]|uniref:DUF998 domain-containing protein n=1 Tax=Tianweitania aestuarii TaxID=2814886 RepID=A0ABS5RT05_9HYPH|nr:hypothetical protein [Tianweitania aestuarii]MBS9719416.1 hypothetical protein [Tianweitania aestuarii]
MLQMGRPGRFLQGTCLALLLGLVVTMIAVSFALHRDRELAAYLMKENGPFELIGFASCIGATIMLALACARYFKRQAKALAFWCGLLALGFFMIGMEEISWGQSFFAWTTPEVFSANQQSETNLHNMGFIHLRAHDIGITLLALYFVVLPTAYAGVKAVQTTIDRIELPVPPLAVSMLFAACFVFFQILFSVNYHNSQGVPINYGEMQEFVYQICFLVFAWSEFARAGSAIADPAWRKSTNPQQSSRTPSRPVFA